MGIFFLVNGWAGRYGWLDEVMRFLYVGTVPLLATILLALLLFAPPRVTDPMRRRIVGATLLAGILSLLTYLLVEFFIASLGVSTLSPRPFMTRYVNLLVVEPQDNSFPAPELMLAAVLVTSIWAMRLRLGLPALGLLLVLGFARIFCGTNYFADVLVGALIGLGWGALALCAFKVPLRLNRPQQLPAPSRRLSLQGGFAAMALMGLALTLFSALASDPRFAARLQAALQPQARAATAGGQHSSGPTRAARGVMQEGEGPGAVHSTADDAEAHALAKRSNLFLPEAEASLKKVLGPVAAPCKLLDVEVAPVTAGTSPYRCAALRFEAGPGGPGQRAIVAAVAARLVQTAFRADGQLESVDVTAITRGDGRVLDRSELVFVGDEVPVFTASVLRRNLRTPLVPVSGQSGLAGEAWLRLHSKLYVNERVLPQVAVVPAKAPPPLPRPQNAGPAAAPAVRPALKPTPKPLGGPAAGAGPTGGQRNRPSTRPRRTPPRPTPARRPLRRPQGGGAQVPGTARQAEPAARPDPVLPKPAPPQPSTSVSRPAAAPAPPRAKEGTGGKATEPQSAPRPLEKPAPQAAEPSGAARAPENPGATHRENKAP